MIPGNRRLSATVATATDLCFHIIFKVPVIDAGSRKQSLALLRLHGNQARHILPFRQALELFGNANIGEKRHSQPVFALKWCKSQSELVKAP